MIKFIIKLSMQSIKENIKCVITFKLSLESSRVVQLVDWMRLRAVLQLSASMDGASSCWFLLFVHPSHQSSHLACQNVTTDGDVVEFERSGRRSPLLTSL